MDQNFEHEYQEWRDQCDRIAKLDKLFVVGCVKSGTTWMMNLLNGHPQIVIRCEGAFACQLAPFLAEAFKVFNKHQAGKDPISHLREIDLIRTARTLIDSQLSRYVQESGRNETDLRIVGDKTPQHTISLMDLALLYPNAKFLNIIRDPRDVATSAWFHFGKTDKRSFEEYIRYFITQVWPINVGVARKNGAALGRRYHEISYEEMHYDEAAHLETILKFLNVDASEKSVQACLDAGNFSKRSGGRERGQTDQKSFYRSGTTGDWRNHLPIDLVDACCKSIAPLMQECGYDPECTAMANS